MTDCFSLFDLPRRPAVDDSSLRETYLRLAARLHPDSAQGEAGAFAVLQEALQILSHPAQRLRHLLQLEFPEYQSPSSIGGANELFFQIGDGIRRAQAVTEKLNAAKSNLARALLTSEGAAALETLRRLRQAAEAAQTAAIARLAQLDVDWPQVMPADLAVLATEFTYLAKWLGELSEGEFRLAQFETVRSLGG